MGLLEIARQQPDHRQQPSCHPAQKKSTDNRREGISFPCSAAPLSPAPGRLLQRLGYLAHI